MKSESRICGPWLQAGRELWMQKMHPIPEPRLMRPLSRVSESALRRRLWQRFARALRRIKQSNNSHA